MQSLILFFPALLLDVLTDQLFIPMLTHRAYIVAIRPELSSPKLLFYLWARRKDFSRRYTLDRLHDLLRAIGRHTLHQKMHMVFVSPDFQKCDLVARTNLHTNLFELEVYFRRKDNSSILRWTDNVIEKHRNIMALMNEAAHSLS